MTEDIEFQSVEAIKDFQEKKLREALDYLAANSSYYKRMFSRFGIDVSAIRHREDLVKIPFTEKKDLQLYNEDFLCVPKDKVIDYITTSGTLGDPVTFCCTEKDLQRLAYNEKKSFECAGVHPGNVVQLMTTIDKRFMAGLAYFLGIRELGAGIIRVGNGVPELQWDTIQRIKPDTIMCVPSFSVSSSTLRITESTTGTPVSGESSESGKGFVIRTFRSISSALRSKLNGMWTSMPHIHRQRWEPLFRSVSTGWVVTCIRNLS